MMSVVTIRTPSIGLAAFLKWAGVTSSGAQAKAMVREGQVKVNGEAVQTPSRMVRPGDTITVGAENYSIEREP